MPSRITNAFVGADGLFERGGEGSQDVDGLANVALDGGDADAERRGAPAVGVAAAQVTGEEPEGRSRTGRQARKLLVDNGSSWS